MISRAPWIVVTFFFILIADMLIRTRLFKRTKSKMCTLKRVHLVSLEHAAIQNISRRKMQMAFFKENEAACVVKVPITMGVQH